MKRSPILAVAFLLASSYTVCAQAADGGKPADAERLHVGLVGGTSSSWHRSGDGLASARETAGADGLGMAFGFAAGYRLGEMVSIEGRVAIDRRTFQVKRRTPDALILLPGTDAQATFAGMDVFDVRYDLLSVDAGASVDVVDLGGGSGVDVVAGVSLGAVRGGRYDGERITHEPDVTYDGVLTPEAIEARRWYLARNAPMSGLARTRLALYGGVGGVVAITPGFVLRPSVVYDHGVTVMNERERWLVGSLIVRIDLLFAP